MQQAISWTNVDPDICRHVASLGHNELINVCVSVYHYYMVGEINMAAHVKFNAINITSILANDLSAPMIYQFAGCGPICHAWYLLLM